MSQQLSSSPFLGVPFAHLEEPPDLRPRPLLRLTPRAHSRQELPSSAVPLLPLLPILLLLFIVYQEINHFICRSCPRTVRRVDLPAGGPGGILGAHGISIHYVVIGGEGLV